ncbi:MAG: peptidoglycan DD-metalloendopeptidase family protein [Bryobacteraceae bacterium]|nr:peptidoglycan DD-metalloendopeptidase family protein [Bryobacteraceae bacterium]MDW8377011.1 peptidoglycan DD-metalloendopeptidase family protein [Bryobacterales bacterium]
MTLGKLAHPNSCAVSSPTTSFDQATPQIFLKFVLMQVAAGEPVTVEWVDPKGEVFLAAPYENLPAAPSLCLMSQLPVAGFPAAQRPGLWQVRILSRGNRLAQQSFQIASTASNTLRISRISARERGSQQTELVLEGEGFNAESTIHLAQYTNSGGWRYLAHLFPHTWQANRMVVTVGSLRPAEYVVFVRNGPHALSAPARFLVRTPGGYRLPFPPSERWVISQGPYGAFSHWGRTVHAYDIAPRSGGCVVAMRAGTAYAFDLGLGQTPHRRIFGNYITIDHGDGEFSHYAHLRAGSFRVRTGEWVEQGQALALVGNSGYSFGAHVHVQVTRSFSISSQSVPFEFEEQMTQRASGSPLLSQNESPDGDCQGKKGRSPIVLSLEKSRLPEATRPATWSGEVAVTFWWSELTTVSRGTKSLVVTLRWEDPDQDFDLHVVSPLGRHYSAYTDGTGYRQIAQQKSFEIPSPEPGTWRVSVQGVKGKGTAMPFSVFVSPPPPAERRAAGGALSRP